jgi:hypothetical protein
VSSVWRLEPAIRLVKWIVAIVAAVAVALAIEQGLVSLAPTWSVPVSPFGGSASVHIAHIGDIEIDLRQSGIGTLRRLPCVRARGMTCFVAMPRVSTRRQG